VVERLTFEEIRSGRWKAGGATGNAAAAERQDDPRAKALLP
jgi:hypothetical protein